MGGPPRLVLGILAVATLLSFAGDAAAQNATDGNATLDYAFTVRAVASKDEWATKTLSFPAGAKVELIYNSTGAVLPHDIQIYRADGTTFVTGTEKNLPSDSPPARTGIFTMDAAGMKYICSVHPTTMVGALNVGVPGADAGGEGSITSVGVHYLAYWVGVISFAVLFISYGTSFFLFKHGETPQTTDHADRPGFEDKKTIAGLPDYVWIIVGILVVAAGVAIFFQQMLSGF